MAAPTLEELKPLSESASTSTDQQSGLFKLPPELRLNIYEILFAELYNTAGSSTEELFYLAALLYTSKQPFIEARPAFLKQAAFILDRLNRRRLEAENEYSFTHHGVAIRQKIQSFKRSCDCKKAYNRTVRALACVTEAEILSSRIRTPGSERRLPLPAPVHHDSVDNLHPYFGPVGSWNTPFHTMRSGPPIYLNVQSVPSIRSGEDRDSEYLNSAMDFLAIEERLKYHLPD